MSTQSLELRPVAKNTLVSQAALSIREYIVNGGFKAGDKLLSEKELCSKLSVSRTVLREALRSLEAVGIIHVRDGAGAYVSEVNAKTIAQHLTPLFEMSSDDDMEHMVEARVAVEAGSVPFIVERYSKADAEHLRKILQRFGKAVTVEEIHKVEADFHIALIKIAGNPLLTEFSSFLVQFFAMGRKRLPGTHIPPESVAESHKELLLVIERGDIAEAQKAVTGHILEWSRKINA